MPGYADIKSTLSWFLTRLKSKKSCETQEITGFKVARTRRYHSCADINWGNLSSFGTYFSCKCTFFINETNEKRLEYTAQSFKMFYKMQDIKS